jgi:hypothetical protein
MQKPGEGGLSTHQSTPFKRESLRPLVYPSAVCEAPLGYPEPARRRQAKPRGHRSLPLPRLHNHTWHRSGAMEEVVVTAGQFRRLAMSFPEALESSHMKHPELFVFSIDSRNSSIWCFSNLRDTLRGLMYLHFSLEFRS